MIFLADQKARESRLILWILYARALQINTIEFNLAEYQFRMDENVYKAIILDLLESEKFIVEECIKIFEFKALEHERFYYNLK